MANWSEHRKPSLLSPFSRTIRGLYYSQSYSQLLVWQCDIHPLASAGTDGFNQEEPDWATVSDADVSCRPDPSAVTEELWGEEAALAKYVLFLPDTVQVAEDDRVYNLRDEDGNPITEEGARSYYEVLSVRRFRGRGETYHHIEALLSMARAAE